MTQSGQSQLGNALEDRARQVADEVVRVARALAERAESVKRSRKLARTVNVVVGFLAVIVALSPPVAQVFGMFGVRTVGVAAAIVLILDGILPVFFGDDSFDRLSDYSMYLHGYANSILDTLADESMKNDVRNARLSEILSQAGRNLVDVRSKWPWVDHPKTGG
jgi:hypothetical protein